MLSIAGRVNVLGHTLYGLDKRAGLSRFSRTTSLEPHALQAACSKLNTRVHVYRTSFLPPRWTPYTPHPAPHTLHPTPYNLHPTPYTLHPSPLHPTPNTLHPTPYTLHPTPYTLHPTPFTHGREAVANKCAAAERGGKNVNGFKDCYLEAKARIWP